MNEIKRESKGRERGEGVGGGGVGQEGEQSIFELVLGK